MKEFTRNNSSFISMVRMNEVVTSSQPQLIRTALHVALVLIYEAVPYESSWLPRRDGKSIHSFILRHHSEQSSLLEV